MSELLCSYGSERYGVRDDERAKENKTPGWESRTGMTFGESGKSGCQNQSM